MNPRRQEFAKHFVLSGNADEAARRAGYAPGSAKVTASRLLTDANVLAAVRSYQREHEAQLQLSRARVLNELVEAIKAPRAKQDPGAMIAGWREVGRICGYYTPERDQKYPTGPVKSR